MGFFKSNGDRVPDHILKMAEDVKAGHCDRREFLALAAGEALPDDPLRPRFDRMEASSLLIASAWEARRFEGATAMAI